MPSPWAARSLNCSMTEKSNVKSDVAICGTPDVPVAPPDAPDDPDDSPPLSSLQAESRSPTKSSAPTTAVAFQARSIGSPHFPRDPPALAHSPSQVGFVVNRPGEPGGPPVTGSPFVLGEPPASPERASSFGPRLPR